MPERHPRRLAGSGSHDHAVERDLLDAPRGRAEHERVAGTAFVDHLFIELADARSFRKKDAEEPTVGDRPAVGDGDAARALTRADAMADAVPHQARAQLCELVRGIAPGQQIEDRCEGVVGELGEVRGAPYEGEQRVDVPFVDGACCYELLCEHIEWVARVARLLDEPGAHARHHDRGFEEVAAILREQLAATRLADVMPGTTDPLQAPRDRSRRLDLDNEINRTHVDAELERARGDEGT